MKNPDQIYNQAVHAATQGQYELALVYLRELFVSFPNLGKAHHLAAASMMRMGKFADALPHARSAVAAAPGHAPSRLIYGVCLAQTGRLEEAIPEFRVGCELTPQDAQSWNNLGHALLDTRRFEHAEIAFRKGLAISNQVPQMSLGLAWCLLHTGRADEAVEVLKKQLAHSPQDAGVLHALALMPLYSARSTNESLRESHAAYARRIEGFAPPNPTRQPDPTPADADRPLRVGFLSPDLYGHSVSRFLEPLLRHADPSRMVFGLYSAYVIRDEITGRLEQMASLWCDMFKLSDQAGAAEIRAHGLDILIDLAGHMPKSRSALLCHRPAPVSMTYIGYPHSTGFSRVDYRIVDSITDPPGESEAFCTEKLLRLDPCFLCFSPAIIPPDVGPPIEPGRPVCFGSFNNIAKVTPELLDLWARILVAEPGSRLLVKSYTLSEAGTKARITKALSDRGVDPARIEMAGLIPSTREHLLSYQKVDIALDTFPYHGVTTTCEALLMGVPVITLLGDSHRSRVGGSILSAAGVPELITRTPDEYVQSALALARDRSRLTQYRTTLRERTLASTLMDGPGFFDRFEKLLRAVWREKCSSGG